MEAKHLAKYLENLLPFFMNLISQQTTTELQEPKTEPQTSGIPAPGPLLHPRFLLSHFITLKMSFLEENPGVTMDSEDQERDDPQCCSEDPSRDALELGPSLTSVSSAHSSPRVKAKGPEKFSIHDGDHKVLVLDSGTLRAVPYKSYVLPETFFVLASHVGSPCEKKGSPIFLAVSKGELCLCCEKNKGQLHPSLLLKKKNLSDLAAQKEPACPPFTFYRAKVGSKNTLESAAHPGWFVCTSCNAWEPVGMTNTRGRKKHTEFSFHPVCEAEMSPSEVSECAAAPSDAFLSLTP